MNLKAEVLNLRMEINEEIAKKMVPSNILSKVHFGYTSVYTEIKILTDFSFCLLVYASNAWLLYRLLDAS